ncbi:MAG: hypothetical protein HY554_00470 [Elusimicrobia bacterium]|nr:hypothetical protein [Elusimicrobiota bacterium]
MSEPVSPVSCCSKRDESSAAECLLCSRPVCGACRVSINDKTACPACRDQIVAELRQESVAPSMGRAAAAGAAAAVASGIGWAAMVALTGAEIGYAAVGVGYLAGQAVHRASGRRKTRGLQKLSVACAALGLVLGKYFTFAHIAKTQLPQLAGASYLEPGLVQLFVVVLPRLVNAFDALWLFIALSMAWRIPRPTELKLADGRDPAPAPSPAGG